MFDAYSRLCHFYEITVKQQITVKWKVPPNVQSKQEKSSLTSQLRLIIHWLFIHSFKPLPQKELAASRQWTCLAFPDFELWNYARGRKKQKPWFSTLCTCQRFTSNDQHTQTCLLDDSLSWGGSNGEADKLLIAANKEAGDKRRGTQRPDYLSWQMIRCSAGSYMPSVFRRWKCNSWEKGSFPRSPWPCLPGHH